MIQQDLAFVANTLLSLCESDAQRPFYTDEAFAHKLKLAETRDMAFGTVLQGRPHDVLLQAEINDIVDRSRLTPRQRAVLEHRLNG